jgi:hypothetical protein
MIAQTDEAVEGEQASTNHVLLQRAEGQVCVPYVTRPSHP